MVVDLNVNSISEGIRQLVPNRETVFEVVNAVGGHGKRLEVSVVELPKPLPLIPDVAPLAPLIPTPARQHSFRDICTFADYLKKYGTTCTLVLGKVDDLTMVAVLDEAREFDPETITYNAQKHPLVLPWLAKLNCEIPILDFARFLMQNRRRVIAPDGLELAYSLSQIKASKQTTIAVGRGKKAINGVMVQLDIAGESKGVPVELPDSIEISAPLLVGTNPRALTLDLLVTTDCNDEIVAHLSCPDLDSGYLDAFAEQIEYIREATGHLCGFGHLMHREWKRQPFLR